MKTITVTEAKRSLGRYLKRVAAGEEIGIISGSDIISLRRVEVVAADRGSGVRVMETASGDDWPEFPTFDGGPVDGALNHDKYIYEDVPKTRAQKRRP